MGILPVVFLSELAGVLNAACAGIMRGVGRQHWASIINGVCYWAIGLPLCVCVLTFVCLPSASGSQALLLPAGMLGIMHLACCGCRTLCSTRPASSPACAAGPSRRRSA